MAKAAWSTIEYCKRDSTILFEQMKPVSKIDSPLSGLLIRGKFVKKVNNAVGKNWVFG